MNNIVILVGLVITLVTGIPVLMQILRNHPKGLIILFFAEMWERFSYYGMRGILIFYLTQHFLFDDKFSSNQYGSYTSLVYLLPLLGGFVADRFLGTRKAVAFGALLLVFGHLLMGAEGDPAKQHLTYAGQQFEMQLEGRGADRQVHIVVDGKPFEYKASPDGGLEIQGLPENASLPRVLPKGEFKLTETRDPLYVNIFYLALSLIIMGVGFLKPNISTIVGQLYPEADPRRDSGFTLYYYGINLGAFWASALCGYLGQNVGWWAGFGLAGVGMLAGYVVFVLGKPLLQGKGEPPNPEQLKKPLVGPINREYLIYILGLLGVGVVWLLVQRNDWVGMALGAGIVASLAAIVFILMFVCKNWIERQRMLLAMVLIFGAVVFFTLFEQAGTSLNLFADRNVDLNITQAPMVLFNGLLTFATDAQLKAAGITLSNGMFTPTGIWIDSQITAAQTQSFNAGFILIFAPIFAALWAFLGRRNKDPNPVLKFGLGLLQVGLGFLVMVWAANTGLVSDAFRMPLMMLGLLYMLHTTGELCLSPVGLSEITKLSVASVVSFMMAVWFLSSSIAQYVGGWIAGMAGTETVGGQVLDPKLALETSLNVFEMLGYWGVGFGVAFLVISPFIKKWAHGADAGSGPAGH
ncbi:oligopeptide:H+ symporter [Caulobacter sp. 17J65-9]|uniref:peptide MFS transporter n=1 Tax=Caulobacter sp. 17J65-9 TaxID=2709382 RepID=UPI0013C6A50D|nr:oligopeptide:H+ symporter [Caulobacter sp. 17J65-9]NEX92777.1 MFS transporter [Caulobacter sp. 17J65-9]